jgi:hypothetical protein
LGVVLGIRAKIPVILFFWVWGWLDIYRRNNRWFRIIVWIVVRIGQSIPHHGPIRPILDHPDTSPKRGKCSMHKNFPLKRKAGNETRNDGSNSLPYSRMVQE